MSCGQATISGKSKGDKLANIATEGLKNSDTSLYLGNLFTLSDAEKILGEEAVLSDSSSTNTIKLSTFNCAYTAKEKDPKSGKTGNVYVLIEKYKDVSEAKKKYSYIKKANESHEGIKVLEDLGEEAYFHSDTENFYFIMVRNGSYVFNMKVNKITSKTSLEEFMDVAKDLNYEL